MLVKKAGCYGRPFPVMAAAAPLPVYERVAFDANILFDSDKSALRPAGREKLDAFVSNIDGVVARLCRCSRTSVNGCGNPGGIHQFAILPVNLINAFSPMSLLNSARL